MRLQGIGLIVVGVLCASCALLLSPVANADQWRGHLARLVDAQLACTDTNSSSCLPYLAEAVAVANVLSDTSKPLPPEDKGGVVTVTFQNGSQEKCSGNWFRSMNGLRLLHSALGIETDTSETQKIYWVDALVRASRELCHS
jgi:hypothetical protein